MKGKNLEFFIPDTTTEYLIPLSESTVQAGFPSPAADFRASEIDLNRELIRNPTSTFFARVVGDSMVGMGINEGDLLVVDRSIEIYDGCIAVCFVDGEFTLKTVELHEDHAVLIPANDKYKPITVTEDNDVVIWGVLTHWVKSVKNIPKSKRKK